MGGLEATYVEEAFAANWIAPLGPHVDRFEREFCEAVGARRAVALSSGTAAVHLGLRLLAVQENDDVVVSTLTFVASAAPVRYLGATPVFVDSERTSWNMDPELLEELLERRAKTGQRLPSAVVVVDLYGQCADLDRIRAICREYCVAVLEDAAEALGGSYRGRAAGVSGDCGAFSFNGNKIITTSGGGMLVSDDEAVIEHARKLAAQARDPAAHYEHSEIGYNYRLSNVLAGIGRAQLRLLNDRVQARRRNFAAYAAALGGLPGIEFMPEAEWGMHTRWLTTLTIEPTEFGASRDDVLAALAANDIEGRPLWKPMHLQPVFAGCEYVGGGVAEDLFRKGLCLPSGSNLTSEDVESVVEIVLSVRERGGRSDQ